MPRLIVTRPIFFLSKNDRHFSDSVTNYFTPPPTPHNSAPERLGLPHDLYETENQQPEHLRPYFRERLEHYREIGKRFPRGFEYEKE